MGQSLGTQLERETKRKEKWIRNLVKKVICYLPMSYGSTFYVDDCEKYSSATFKTELEDLLRNEGIEFETIQSGTATVLKPVGFFESIDEDDDFVLVKVRRLVFKNWRFTDKASKSLLDRYTSNLYYYLGEKFLRSMKYGQKNLSVTFRSDFPMYVRDELVQKCRKERVNAKWSIEKGSDYKFEMGS